MTITFWDTSCLIKLIKKETGSVYLYTRIQNPAQPPCYISQLAIVEFTSVIYRWLRKGLCTQHDIRLFQSIIALYINQSRLVVVDVNPNDLRLAEMQIIQHGATIECQTYDAIHLAAAFELHSRVGINEFVSADRNLLSLAQAQGLPTLDPETV